MLPTSIDVVLPLVGLGMLPTAAAHTLYFSSLSNLKSFETATMALLEPVGATILGVILFQEKTADFCFWGSANSFGNSFCCKEGELSGETDKKDMGSIKVPKWLRP
ncbi:MAG: EamA family transporter [Candidatus Bathyarchaeota archaeon]|nr:EamA family transporter [Candidatus Bathyarchaeota archaeon]